MLTLNVDFTMNRQKNIYFIRNAHVQEKGAFCWFPHNNGDLFMSINNSSKSTETASPAYKRTNMARTSNQKHVKTISGQCLEGVSEPVAIYTTNTATSTHTYITYGRTGLRRQTGTQFANRTYNPKLTLECHWSKVLLRFFLHIW